MTISPYAIPGIGNKGITTREATYERVTRVVAQHLEIPFKDVFKKCRKRELCLVRQISMYLIKKHCRTFTLKSLGIYFGGRDHSTVIHAVDAITNLMWSDPELKSRVEYIEGYIINTC